MWHGYFWVDSQSRPHASLSPVASGGTNSTGDTLMRRANGTVTTYYGCLEEECLVASREDAVLHLASQCERVSLACVEAARGLAASVIGAEDGQHTSRLWFDGTRPRVFVRRVSTFASATGDRMIRDAASGTVRFAHGETVYASRREAALAMIDSLIASQGLLIEEANGLKKPPFSLGRVLATPGALGVTEDFEPLLRRHASCDWGLVCDADRDANDLAVESGERLLSAYEVDGERLWVITEADRSVTTVLLPEEY
jgi:hypothetical protein